MSKFAKLFEMPNGDQVLVVIKGDEENEDGPSLLALTTDVGGVTMSATLGFKGEEDAQKAFDEYDMEGAEVFYGSAMGMLTEEKA